MSPLETPVAVAPGAKESDQLKPSGGSDRRLRRRSGEQKIIPTGRAATTGARRRILFLRGRRGCSGAGRRLLTWSRPGCLRPAPPPPPPPPHPWPVAPQSLGASGARPRLSAAALPAWPKHPGPVPAPLVALSPVARTLAVASREPRSPAPNARPSRRRAAGSSAGRGGGGSWASAERAARCACAPPPPPPAGGLNHPPPPRAWAAAGGSAGSGARSSSPVTQAPAVCFQVALYLGSQWSVQATIMSVAR